MTPTRLQMKKDISDLHCRFWLRVALLAAALVGLAVSPAAALERLVVLDLLGVGLPQPKVDQLTQVLVDDLKGTGRYQMPSRDEVRQALAQARAAAKPAADCQTDACILEFGKMVQAERIVAGSVKKLNMGHQIELVLYRVPQIEREGSLVKVAESLEESDLPEAIPHYGRELLGLPAPATTYFGQHDFPGRTCAATTGALQKTSWRDPTTGMEFVDVPGGCFQMGCGVWAEACGKSEQPAHEVCVLPFKIGRYEVTQAEWVRVMGSNPASFQRGSAFPVEQVSWEDSQEFIRKISTQSGKTYRLPTEAEWEYAARGGGKAQPYAGDAEPACVAWYNLNSGLTHHVGHRRPNGLGIYDMSGNVSEWCQDWWSEGPIAAEFPRGNPAGPPSGTHRVVRGGSFTQPLQDARTASRNFRKPAWRSREIGLRLVLPADR